MTGKYGSFECSECEYEFADDMPPLYEDLPECPLCAGTTRLLCVLEPHANLWHTSLPAVLLASDVLAYGLPSLSWLWPF